MLNLQPSSITFTAVPTPDPTQTTTLSESGYSGAFSLQSESCTNGTGNTKGDVATISPTTGLKGPSQTITVTADDVGNCTFTFADTNGATKSLTVDVTTTKIVVNKRPRSSTAPIVKATPAPPSPSPKPEPAATPISLKLEAPLHPAGPRGTGAR